MLRYLVRRLLASIPVLLLASFITFALVRISIVPPAKYRHIRDSQRVLAEQREALGLNDSIVVQWWHWLTGFLHGDLGTSSHTRDSVSSMNRYPQRLIPSAWSISGSKRSIIWKLSFDSSMLTVVANW